MNLPWHVVICTLMLFFDRYYLRETRLSGIEVIRKAGVIEQEAKQKKSKIEKGIKDHKELKMTD